jgi:hypothetical protein
MTSLRPSLIATSAARSMRVLASPAAIAAREPIEHGHTTIASGGLEPEAGGANHSSRPNTRSCPGAALEAGAELGLHFLRAGRQGEVHLLAGDDLRHLGIQQPHPAAGGQQALHETQPIGHARGPGEGDGDGFGVGSKRWEDQG